MKDFRAENMNIQKKRKILDELQQFHTKLEIYKSLKEDRQRKALRHELLSKYGKLESTIEELVGKIRFSSPHRFRNVDPFMMGLGVGDLSADDAVACLDMALSYMSKAIGALQSEIGEGVEMAIDKAEKRKRLKQLTQFHNGLVRYKELIVAKKNGKLRNETGLQTLRSELQRKYGGLKTVIEEHGGRSSDYRYEFGEKVKYEIFDSALGSTSFRPYPAEFIINALDTAINEVNKARGNLKSLTPTETGQVQAPEVAPPKGGGNIKAELEQFLKKLKRFRQNQIRVGDTGTSESLEKLREELIRTSARLRNVIAPADGKLLMQQMGHVFDAFDDAFGKPIYPFGLAPQWFTSIDALIQKTNEAIGRLEQVPVLGLPEEALYPSGTPYTAYKDIKEIISSATRALTIVDPYVDSTLFTMLEDVHPKVQIQILTRKMGSDFQLAGQKFKEQREKAQQGTLEVRRESGDFHDRFIVADDKFFHIGASIKDAGDKVFAINEIENSRNKSVLMESIRKSWDAAEKVL